VRNSVSAGEPVINSVDKDPFYKTNGILKGAFQKNIRLMAGQISMTNCRGIIWVNFNPKRFSNIKEEDSFRDGHTVYLLECGHLFKAGKSTTHDVGKCIPCNHCGGEDAYRSFEHEWSHIIFKSNPHLWQMFITNYLKTLEQEGYEVSNIPGLRNFLHLVINSFDDIRSNSLWERVYAGSADFIWKKWKRLCEEDSDLNENFISWIFGVALDTDNLNTQDGPFSDLIPVMIEATDRVRGKGTTNMLTIVRWALDRCVKRLLRNPPPQGKQGGDDEQGGQDAADAATDDESEGSSSGKSGESESSDSESEDQGQDPGSAGSDSGEGQQDDGCSGTDASEDSPPFDQTRALKGLTFGSGPLQEDQDHHVPDSTDRDPSSQANRAAVGKALSANLEEEDQQTVVLGDVDDDMQQQVTRLLNSVRPQNAQYFLLADAKAKILLVDVDPENISKEEEIEISPENKIAINRMRAAFSRVMGRQSNKMSDSGLIVDPQTAIQHRINPNEIDLFEEEVLNKGFAYLTLCDMSGSMQGNRFHQVCVGSQMLKSALDYPFVEDHLWGFRGAIDEGRHHHSYGSQQSIKLLLRGGEIWIYKYDRNCKGYIGRARGRYQDGRSHDVKVECGGLTPMNSAIHVAAKFMLTKVPAGMAKRIFLLTDGYPTHVKTSGRDMGKKMLIDFTAKEVRNARQKGVQIYTFVMGNDIDDTAALQMFGPKRYWERIDDKQSIDKALMSIVLREFTKYLRSK